MTKNKFKKIYKSTTKAWSHSGNFSYAVSTINDNALTMHCYRASSKAGKSGSCQVSGINNDFCCNFILYFNDLE